MNPRLQLWQHVLRELRLLGLAEWFRFIISVMRLHGRNGAFIRENRDFALPPRHLAFDAYSAPDWYFYKSSGETVAAFIAELIREYLPVGEAWSVLEWGCGPGRIIRHMPAALGPAAKIYGTDYNNGNVEWCKRHIHGITFASNDLHPPLPFEAGSFDCIYAASVLTHLSETVGFEWVEEIGRILKLGGLFILSLNGDSHLEMLLSHERKVYFDAGILVRDQVQEGRKMFGAFHNPSFVRGRLLSRFDIVRHSPSGFPCSGQDLWVVRRRK